MKKVLSLVLVLAMVFSAMLGVVSFAEDETTTTTPTSPELDISSASLEFADNVYLLLAVDYSAVGSADGITLKIKNNKTGEESSIDAPASDITAPTSCVAFKYDDIGAKNMGDELSIQAYLNGSASGDPITYSILEYALRAENLANEKLTALVKSMIAYGAEAQKVWNHEGTYDLSVEDYSFIKLKGGLAFESGASKAIVAAGNSVNILRAGADESDIIYTTAMQRVDISKAYVVDGTNQTIFAAPASVSSTKMAGYELDATKATKSGAFMNEITTANCHACGADGKLDDESTCSLCSGKGSFQIHKISTKQWHDAGCARLESTCAYKSFGGTEPSEDVKAQYQYVVKNGSNWFGANYDIKDCTCKNNTAPEPVKSWFTGNFVAYYPTRVSVANGALVWSGGGINFNTNSPGNAIKESIGSYVAAASAGTSTEGLNSVFTISLTLAADGDGKAPISRFHLRRGGAKIIMSSAPWEEYSSGVPGRLTLLNAQGNTFSSYYNEDASKNSNVNLVVSDISGVEAGQPGTFVTIHIVVDVEAMTMTYYVGDDATPVHTVAMPIANIDFFNGCSFNGEPGNNTGYLKTLVVTKGNITDYFK